MADPLDRYLPSSSGFAQPLLDRLMDAEPDQSNDPAMHSGDQLRRLRESVRRDLEALLNTRRPPVTPPSHLGLLEPSLVGFGMDGFVAAALASEASRIRFARAVERRIEMFESRLSNVTVTVLKNRTDRERALRMRIQATFRVHEGMPSIQLESSVDPSTDRIEIEVPND